MNRVLDETLTEHIYRHALNDIYNNLHKTPNVDRVGKVLARYNLSQEVLDSMESYEVRARSHVIDQDASYLKGQLESGRTTEEGADSIKSEVEAMYWVRAIAVTPYVMYWNMKEGAA